MEARIFLIRLGIHATSLPSPIHITRHAQHFRLHLNRTHSDTVELVTYLGPHRVETDGFFRYRTTGQTPIAYEVLEPAGQRQYLVRLTFYPFYPPDGPIQRRPGGVYGDKLWWGGKELKIYAWCGGYGETGPLPYTVVREHLVPQAPPPYRGSAVEPAAALQPGPPGPGLAPAAMAPAHAQAQPNYDHEVAQDLLFDIAWERQRQAEEWRREAEQQRRLNEELIHHIVCQEGQRRPQPRDADWEEDRMRERERTRERWRRVH